MLDICVKLYQLQVVWNKVEILFFDYMWIEKITHLSLFVMIVIKEFKTLSGYSKHHKIREKEVTEKNKEYLLLEAENKVKYNEYNKHLSSVATWY